MKPAPFDYEDPTTLDGALDLLAASGDDAAVIAGGQSLIPLLNLRLARPELVIDLRHIAALTTVGFDSTELRTGSMVRAADLEEHPSTASIPGLADALALIGHSQIRARTTIGGSLAHADPAAELPALLVALDGSVTMQSRGRGERRVPADELFVGPLMTSRAPDELLTAVTIPRHRGRVVIDEVANRPGDFAIVGAITAYATTAGLIVDPRIVVFGVAGTPVRVRSAEAVLVGATPGPDVFRAAATVVRNELDPVGDSHGSADYRRHLAGVLVERNLAAT